MRRFLVTAVKEKQTDKRKVVTNIYDLETLENSDLRDSIPNQIGEAKTFIDRVESFEEKAELWITTITRIA